MSTNPHHRCHRQGEGQAHPRIRPATDLFARANPFLDAVWRAADEGLCLTAGCTDCGTLAFRRMLADIDGEPHDAPLNLRSGDGTAASAGPLASAVAGLDFDLLRLAPRWYDALDVALFHLRDRGQLGHALEDWVRRPAVPPRILDLVLFRHARYGYPCERLADLWIDRCLEMSADTGDEGLVESLILSCPERVGADPRAYRAAMEAASRSACVRSIVRRLGECG
jgi:hypothetical protein